MNEKDRNYQRDAEAEAELPHMSVDECERALADLMAELEESSSEERESVPKGDKIFCVDKTVDNPFAELSEKDGFKQLDGEKAFGDAVFAFTLTDENSTEPSGEPEDEDFLSAITAFEENADTVEYTNDDELFSAAARLVVEEGVTSVSFLQRRFAIGYGKALKIISRLEELSIVSKAEGNLPRKVLVSAEKLEKILSEL